jgi:GNAT superfamily N-acetyltransferase
VEALGRFLEPTGSLVVRQSRRYSLVAQRGENWAAVEGIRLRAGEAVDAVADVQSFLHETDTRIASWWLTGHTTPAGAEDELLAAGLERVDDDYLHAGMLATTAPPAADVEARRIDDVDEYVRARRLKEAVFGTHGRTFTDEELAAAFSRDAKVTYGAWLDGELVAAADATFTRVGAYLTGGATLPEARGRGAYRALVRARWDDAAARGTPALAIGAGEMSRPILERLGFEQVLQFRRLQSVRAA